MMLKTDLSGFENSRCEKKFVVSELGLYEVEHLIKHHPAIFSEMFRERTVNNIYLDSADFKNYREHVEGTCERLKARIRWYGETFNLIEKPVLELKIKNNELGKKLHFPLRSFVLDKNFSSGLLQKVFSESELPKWLIEKLRLYCLTLLNSYKRKYFISANKKHRITLDWDMKFFKIGNKDNFFSEFVADKETHIVEIKYSSKDYEKTENITEHFPFRLVKHSKYVYGLDLLDF